LSREDRLAKIKNNVKARIDRAMAARKRRAGTPRTPTTGTNTNIRPVRPMTNMSLAERLDLKKASMGEVIKDFQASDAPQFKGKSNEKKRMMAVAAKLEAERAK